MPRVICTLPNASLLINGVVFEVLSDKSGIISEEIEQGVAEYFASIPGYRIDAEEPGSEENKQTVAPKVVEPKEPVLTAAQKAAATKAANKAAEAAKAAEEAEKAAGNPSGGEKAEDAKPADDAGQPDEATGEATEGGADNNPEIF